MQVSPASWYVLLSRNILLNTLFMALRDMTPFSLNMITIPFFFQTGTANPFETLAIQVTSEDILISPSIYAPLLG